MYRQGDVLLEKVQSAPRKASVKEDMMVAYGETMHHAHQIQGEKSEVFVGEDGNLYVTVGETATLQHIDLRTKGWSHEHHAIPLEAGTYRVTIQNEYDPYEEKAREVRD